MTLTLPDEPALTHLGEVELKLELACGLYASRHLSRSAAARLAGLETEDFEEELHQRGISNGYADSDLQVDLLAMKHIVET